MSKKRHILAAAITLGLAAPAIADQLDDIKHKGELVCGTLGVTRGMSFVNDADRQLIGYEVDLCGAIAASLDVKPVMKALAVPARIPELQQGRIDIVLGELSVTEERAKVVDFSNPYFVVRSTVMVNDPAITDFAGLGGKKIATTKGTTAEEKLREMIPTANVVSFDTTSQAFLAFTQGKVAGYATDEASLFTSRAALGDAGKNMAVLEDTLDMDRQAAGVKQGETALLDKVNEVFAALEKSGEADAMFIKWFGPETDIGYVSRTFKIDGSASN